MKSIFKCWNLLALCFDCASEIECIQLSFQIYLTHSVWNKWRALNFLIKCEFLNLQNLIIRMMGLLTLGFWEIEAVLAYPRTTFAITNNWKSQHKGEGTFIWEDITECQFSPGGDFCLLLHCVTSARNGAQHGAGTQ